MKSYSFDLHTVFNSQNIIAIPEYQRNYSWGVEQWHFLIRDILAACTSTKPFHWLGILLMETKMTPIKDVLRTKKYIIDGQQRLITLRIWWAALEHHAQSINNPLPKLNLADFEIQKSDEQDFNTAIENNWLNCSREKLNQGPLGAYYYFRWLLWLGEDAILSDSPTIPPKYNPKNRNLDPIDLWIKTIQPSTNSNNGASSSHAKKKTIRIQSNPPNVNDLYSATLQKLSITVLEIEPQIDEEPSLIFETLNANRLSLEPFDHVRNRVFMLMREEVRNQESVSNFYQNKWQPAEASINNIRNKRVKNITAFLYDYLISKGETSRQQISTRNTAAAFEAFLQNKRTANFSISKFLEDDFLPSMQLWSVAKGVDKHSPISLSAPILNDFASLRLIESINSLSDGPPVPLILHYLFCLKSRFINEQDLIKQLFIIEGLLVRFMLVDKDFSPNRALFMQICANIGQDPTLQKLIDVIRPLWPQDNQILSYEILDPIYTRWGDNLGPLFRGIERALSGNHANWVTFGKGQGHYSVEHIVPQTLNKDWENDIKAWKQNEDDIKARVNALGNLTILSNSHNSSVRNSSLNKKISYFHKPGVGAPMKINNSWLNASKWTVKNIDDRTKILRKAAIDYWVI